jgi:hypothetical protein
LSSSGNKILSRDDLAVERVRVLNRLHVLLRDLIPRGAPDRPHRAQSHPPPARRAATVDRRTWVKIME